MNYCIDEIDIDQPLGMEQGFQTPAPSFTGLLMIKHAVNVFRCLIGTETKSTCEMCLPHLSICSVVPFRFVPVSFFPPHCASGSEILFHPHTEVMDFNL